MSKYNGMAVVHLDFVPQMKKEILQIMKKLKSNI